MRGPDSNQALSSLPPRGGIGLKPVHYRDVLAPPTPSTGESDTAQRPAWVEVHPQNYFGIDGSGGGGPPHRWLTAIREHYPLSFHSVGLSMGSAEGLDADELEAVADLVDRYRPAVFSDHLSWSGNAHDRYPDLLPIPYTQEALDHFAAQIGRVQDRLKRPMLIENPSRYLGYAGDEMDETDFLISLCRRAGCGLLFDVNNVEVSCTNMGLDPKAYVDAIPAELVGEMHLAGHAREEHDSGPLLIDDHGSRVTAVTWALYARFIERAGPKPTLIEWDTDIPDYAILMGEMAKIDAVLADPAVLPDMASAAVAVHA